MPLEHPDPVWVLTNDQLSDCCKKWLKLDAIALDTEFIRTDTFYPIPGLVQVGTGEEAFLIDPLSVTDWSPFGEVIASTSVTKVLHACSEDLEVFQILTGVKPAAMIDSQLAASYAGLGHSLSYQNLLRHLLNIDLPKDATRSDWLQRPLTETQISYATLDVTHLLETYEVMKKQLDGQPQWQWLKEDCANMEASSLYIDPAEVWRDVKRNWQLRPRQLAVLKNICEYRELQARKRNIPRNRVIPKSSLWLIARHIPDNIQSLSAIQDMKPKMVRTDGDIILQLIEQAKSLPNEQLPAPLPAPLPKAAKDYGKLIKVWLGHKSEQLGVPVELLFSGKMSSAILRYWQSNKRFAVPDSIQGWRRTEVAEPLIIELKEHQTQINR
ncbi:ribonuclease D [Endozoicomonas sp. OPT23]|uniref:ribonuclease D n=1 Tax=Endozoicomonas sp. OPT23 TaxID=2072845 RepID=UPI00129A7350|nr:ribonuclease D [Endozoicomonas sp. OPT23]MRI32366.1 ribonuclease D [Endozoicomonas sp. OPT23]